MTKNLPFKTKQSLVAQTIKDRVEHCLQPSKYLCADVDDNESVRRSLRHDRANPLEATPRATPTTSTPTKSKESHCASMQTESFVVAIKISSMVERGIKTLNREEKREGKRKEG